jgi:hypothetical protein
MRERTSFYNAFNSEFEKQLPLSKDYSSAFQAASEKFQNTCGQSPYSNFNSFKAQRSKRKRK